MKKLFYKNKYYKGIWFCGMSGSGKTFSSRFLNKKIKNSIIIDGDDVRKYISTDLGRSVESRKIQLQRLLGIAIISLQSELVPIVSGVYMNNSFIKKIKKSKILVVKVERDFSFLKNHKTYKNKYNVVGKDIKYPKINSVLLFNDSTKNFEKILNRFLK